MNFSPASRALQDGENALASQLRGLLAVASWLYTLVVAARNVCYDRRAAKVRRVAAPVVSVGNLTLGGTGKTPLVEWLVRWFQTRGVAVAIWCARRYPHGPPHRGTGSRWVPWGWRGAGSAWSARMHR